MAKRKSALGGGYRSAVMAARAGETAAPETGSTTRKPVTRPKASFYLLPDVLERARDTVDFLSGPPLRLTLTQLVEDAINREVDRLAKAHHKGKPFPTRSGRLRPGSRTKI